MRVWRLLLLAMVLVLMAVLLSTGRDRSIDLANALVKAGHLRQIDREEARNLQQFLTASLETIGVEPALAINQPYRRGRLNLYIVEGRGAGDKGLARGNAAYVTSSDILFVDSLYFDFGRHATFADYADDLTSRVLTTLRVHAFFVLAHELGHRQLGHGRYWLSWFSRTASHAREIEADDFAVALLKQLYATDDSRRRAGIPAPISSLTDFFGKGMTPLQRISDHFSHSVALLADEIFDSPFPILTGSGTHPAFITRLRSVIARLKADAQISFDEAAMSSLTLSEAVTAATDQLISMEPVEIELDNPVQYAFLDAQNLNLVGNDGSPVRRIALSTLSKGTQYRVELPAPDHMASVRYAWAGQEGEALLLRRDGWMRRIAVASGETLGELDLRDELGDSSCVKRFLSASGSGTTAYFSYCRQGQPHAIRVNADGSFASMDLRLLAARGHALLRGASADTQRIVVKTLAYDAAARPTLVHALGDEAYSLTLTTSFEPVALKMLALAAADLPDAISNGEVSGTPGAILVDADGRPYFAQGTPVFRDIGIYDALTISDEAIAAVDLSPGIEEARLRQRLGIHSSYFIGRNRLILDFAENGSYLMDFTVPTLLPLRRNGFRKMEQIGANDLGDWIYFRKYEKRILLFKGDGNE